MITDPRPLEMALGIKLIPISVSRHGVHVDVQSLRTLQPIKRCCLQIQNPPTVCPLLAQPVQRLTITHHVFQPTYRAIDPGHSLP